MPGVGGRTFWAGKQQCKGPEAGQGYGFGFGVHWRMREHSGQEEGVGNISTGS